MSFQATVNVVFQTRVLFVCLISVFHNFAYSRAQTRLHLTGFKQLLDAAVVDAGMRGQSFDLCGSQLLCLPYAEVVRLKWLVLARVPN